MCTSSTLGAGGVSPYAPIVFMRSWRAFSRFYTFEEASPAELEAWTSCFMRFLKKVGRLPLAAAGLWCHGWCTTSCRA